MIGAWIQPNGKIYWTDNALSHELVINELKISKKLKNVARKMQWTHTELAMHLNTDLPYIAMKLGYIRITTYSTYFDICTGVDKKKLSKKQLQAISQVYSTLAAQLYESNKLIFTQIEFERFMQHSLETFNSLYEFIEQCQN